MGGSLPVTLGTARPVCPFLVAYNSSKGLSSLSHDLVEGCRQLKTSRLFSAEHVSLHVSKEASQLKALQHCAAHISMQSR